MNQDRRVPALTRRLPHGLRPPLNEGIEDPSKDYHPPQSHTRAGR
jgi:hypothetical protein